MIPGMFLQREEEPQPVEESPYKDTDLLELHKRLKKEAFEHRWMLERKWMQCIHYINRRHWIEYVRRSNEWRDVKLAKWFPKPVNHHIEVGVQSLRAMFAAVDIGVNVRPNGADPKNVAVASIADDYGPVLHNDHRMDEVLNEADYWFVGTGNSFLHTYLERDAKHGFDEITFEMCRGCQTISGSDQIAEAKNVCPQCQSEASGGVADFDKSNDPQTGEPVKRIPKGKGVTIALSPFEIAFKSSYARFEDVPDIVRLRWRPKTYYESHPVLKVQTAGFVWSKAPAEQSLQLFRSLPYQSDLGVAPFLGGGSSEEEGAAEYEHWIRPCNAYPDGLVFRVLGDSNPIILRQEEDEALPGPIPYRDAEEKPLFPFEHAAFEQRGGCVWGVSPIEAALPKINHLNQHDAFGLMVVNRMGNPLWMIPKGAEIEKFTGEPGLVVKWNPLTVGGNAKPERIDGIELGPGFFTYRDSLVKDVEDALGTHDILKGEKPPSVDSFAGMNLLVEQGQARFTSAFKARGRLYAGWFKHALEIEREFGPTERTEWILSPAGKWRQQLFQSAKLQGAFTVIVEEGSQKPKTALGIRAAIEHLNGLGLIDASDPDQRYAIYQAFGQTKLNPALDIHMMSALRKQQAFEEWAIDPQRQEESRVKAEGELMEYEQKLAAIPPPVQAEPQLDPATGMPLPVDPAIEQQQMQAEIPPPPSVNAQTPLKWRRGYKADVHYQEYMKWVNSDRIVELITENPALEVLLDAHLDDIEMAMQQQMMVMSGQGPTPPQGAGMAMANSNQEAGGLGVMPGQPGAAKGKAA